MSREQDPESGKTALLWVLLGIFTIWTVQVTAWHWHLSLTEWGLFPRTTKGLLGILTMPFLHGDLDHIVNNSFGLLVTGWILLFAYPHSAKPTLAIGWLLTGMGVWLMGRPSFHIGASGLVYSLSAFLFFSCIIRRTRRAIGYGMIVAFFFGASIWGILPFQKGVSWEGHLAGLLSGILSAWLFRKRDVPIAEQMNKRILFKEPSHWPVSEIPYSEGTVLDPVDRDPIPGPLDQPSHNQRS